MNPIIFRFLFNTTEAPDFNLAIDWLKENLGQEIAINQQVAAMTMFTFLNTDMNYGHIPVRIPDDPYCESDLKNEKWKSIIDAHQSHAALTCIGKNWDDPMEMVNNYRLASTIVIAMCKTFGATAVHIDGSNLLIDPEEFVGRALQHLSSHQILPVAAWLNIKTGKDANGNFGYTKGIKQFDLKELEILDSQQSEDEIFELLCNIASYSILNRVKFKDGETMGYSETMKIPISKVKGRFNKGKVYRMHF